MDTTINISTFQITDKILKLIAEIDEFKAGNSIEIYLNILTKMSATGENTKPCPIMLRYSDRVVKALGLYSKPQHHLIRQG